MALVWVHKLLEEIPKPKLKEAMTPRNQLWTTMNTSKPPAKLLLL
jgi:hypothetical protein